MRHAGILGLALGLAGCGSTLNEDMVRMFVDRADRAYLEGRAHDICSMRGDGFELKTTTYLLAQGTTVAGLAEAEAIDRERSSDNREPVPRRETMNLQEFCLMALTTHEYYKRATMERTRIEVEMSGDGKSAVVRAHYVIKEPMYAYADSSIGMQDHVERQVATLQTESDDVSVVTTNRHGELVFASTESVNRSFQIAKERDSRL
jgi:hypothetical protein